MIAIQDDRIKITENGFIAECVCGKASMFSKKMSALKMLKRKNCRYCKRDYRNVNNKDLPIYKIGDKWGKNCSGCGVEQLYTRKDHAKQSYLSDWQCKKCVSSAKGFSQNRSVGDKQRMYNYFSKSAKSRGIEWGLSIDDMFASYNGYCNMTGWEISISYFKKTASLDRIDNTKGYIIGNIQWVHSMVNMCKNKYDNEKFLKMCIDIAKQQNK